MALDAVVFPQDLFGYTMKELCSLGGAWGYDFNGMGEIEEKKGGILLGSEMGGEEGAWNPNWDSSRPLSAQNFNHWDANSSPPEAGFFRESAAADSEAAPLPTAARRKRQRTKKYKNKEEVENQRMTHIAVERNRRKQMNEYLAVLRSIMPPSYVQRGDQASIIGGAINFVKELEQLLQSLEAQKLLDHRSETATPFADFFTFPQYSSRPAHDSSAATSSGGAGESTAAENRSAVADIEVTMVESHASLKVLSRRRPKQLLKMVVGLQNLRLTTLHLNVTTVDPMVLYSFSLKVEEGCELTSVDEIAAAVHRMIGKIEHDAAAADLVVN